MLRQRLLDYIFNTDWKEDTDGKKITQKAKKSSLKFKRRLPKEASKTANASFLRTTAFMSSTHNIELKVKQ